MTLFEKASQKMRQEQGFTQADIAAVWAIFEAVPYAAKLYPFGRVKMCHPSDEKAFFEQADAIARMYQTHFKNAADRKEEFPR